MDISRAKQVLDPSDRLAIYIKSTGIGSFHAGIVYLSYGVRYLFHQEFHLKTTQEVFDGNVLDRSVRFVVVDCENERLDSLIGLLRLVAKTNEPIGYALKYFPDIKFDTLNGKLLLGSGLGLSCSTFVMVLFVSAGYPLVDHSTWPTELRAGDLDRQNELVKTLELHKVRFNVSEEHINEVKKEIGCVRYRPEEVAGAAFYSPLPIGFINAELAGVHLLGLKWQ